VLRFRGMSPAVPQSVWSQQRDRWWIVGKQEVTSFFPISGLAVQAEPLCWSKNTCRARYLTPEQEPAPFISAYANTYLQRKIGSHSPPLVIGFRCSTQTASPP
jgi:hypothetical protein